MSIFNKTKNAKRFGVALVAALAISPLSAVSAQAITDCPVGWSTDYYSTPLACDTYIEADGSFVVPAGVTSIAVLAVGGGGAGGAGGSIAGVHKAGGGGGGAEISQALLTVTPGDTLTADIGLGGAQASVDTVSGAATNGGDGATTTLKDAQSNVLVSAVGGKGGQSGTNGGAGGASGNSNPALVNAGGAGFNGAGSSSGGGGGSQFGPGFDGALNNAGDGGAAGAILGLNGMPSTISSNYGLFRNTTLYPNYYPGYEWPAGAGLGGGGGTYQNDGDGCTDDQYGNVAVPTAFTPPFGTGSGSCEFSSGYNGVANLNYAGGFPGQGGAGGVGVASNSDTTDRGTFGVDGLIWVRAFVEAAPPPPTTSPATFLDASSGSLPFGGSLTVTTDADPTAGYWMAAWVDGQYAGPAPVTATTMNFNWQNFSFIASCAGSTVKIALYDVSQMTEGAPDPELAIDSFTFNYGGNPSLCQAAPKPTKTVGNVQYFKGNSAKLSAGQKKAIANFVTRHPLVSSFTCTGYVAAKTSISANKALGQARASAVCGYIKKLKPTAVTKLAAAKPLKKFSVKNRKVVISATAVIG